MLLFFNLVSVDVLYIVIIPELFGQHLDVTGPIPTGLKQYVDVTALESLLSYRR